MTTSKFSTVVIVGNNANAHALAKSTGLDLITEQEDNHQFQYTLEWIENKLTLRDHSHKKPFDITADFTTGSVMHRKKFGGGHGQPIARAVKTRDHPVICDATAGFGKDSFIFASLGCEVILIEQSAIVHALLTDAIERAKQHPDTQEQASRMIVYHANSAHLPEVWKHSQLPDVVYLDPMYPEGKRIAKKEIQTLRQLLDTEQDEGALLTAARNTAQRVVVKRPKNAPPLAGVTPSGSITSPKTRYDIYST